jgi:hypothetical protein
MNEPSSPRHVWRWKDEDPIVVVLLVIISAFLIAAPWGGCGPAARHGNARPLMEAAIDAVEEPEAAAVEEPSNAPVVPPPVQAPAP